MLEVGAFAKGAGKGKHLPITTLYAWVIALVLTGPVGKAGTEAHGPLAHKLDITGSIRDGLSWVAVAAMVWLAHSIRQQRTTSALRVEFEAHANERMKAARELQDSILQAFQGLMLRFHVASESLPKEHPARVELTTALAKADLVIVEWRERIQRLRWNVSREASFAESIALVGQRLRWNKGVDFKVIAVGLQVELIPLVRDELCWILREALANSFSTAMASKIEVEIRFELDKLEIICRDNGSGSDGRTQNADRELQNFGLAEMRGRANTIGATIDLRDVQLKGTELVVSIPAARVYRHPAGKLRRTLRFLQRLAIPWQLIDPVEKEVK